MPIKRIEVPMLFDTQKVGLQVLPRNSSTGKLDTSVVVNWVPSDPSIVGVEERADSFDVQDGVDADGNPNMVTCPPSWHIFATTPLDQGVSLVTAKASRYADLEFNVPYQPGIAGELNGSFEGPVSDAP